MNIPGDLQRAQAAAETYQTSPAADVRAEKTPAAGSAAPAGSDQTHLSAAASIVSAAVGQTDVRTDKVAAVQGAIAGGNYHVESAAVAGKLIEHMLGGG